MTAVPFLSPSLYVPIWSQSHSRLEIYQNPDICASRGRAAPSRTLMGRVRLVPWVGTHQSPPGALGAPAPSLSLQHPVVRATQTPPLEILGTPRSLPRGIWKETARSSAPPQNEHFPPPIPGSDLLPFITSRRNLVLGVCSTLTPPGPQWD